MLCGEVLWIVRRVVDGIFSRAIFSRETQLSSTQGQEVIGPRSIDLTELGRCSIKHVYTTHEAATKKHMQALVNQA